MTSNSQGMPGTAIYGIDAVCIMIANNVACIVKFELRNKTRDLSLDMGCGCACETNFLPSSKFFL